MFERYTMAARRVIFFARYEASEFGSSQIDTEYLLLGLLRESKLLMKRLLPPHASADAIRTKIMQHAEGPEKTPTSLDLPLSEASKRVLAYAAEEAQQLNQEDINTGNMLLGLLREDKGLAAEILTEWGLTLDKVRLKLNDQQLEA